MIHKLVIFDCDGVLVDSEPLVNRTEAEFLSARGWAINAGEARARFKGHTFVEVASIIEAQLTTLPRDWVYELAMAIARAFHQELVAIPGVRDVLELLRERGVPLCVASQSVLPRVQLSLQLTELAPYFAGNVFSASMVARPKPAPDLFLHAAASMNIAPDRCVVIEDSPSGVRAAVAAGMCVLGYAADEAADGLRAAGARTFTSMTELPGLLSLD